MSTVHIEIGTTEAKVHSPFEAKDAIKTLPQGWRRWDKEAKCWIIPHLAVDELTRTLQSEGFTVRTSRPAGRPRGRDGWPRAGTFGGSGTWADAMYAALGLELADKAYRALLPVLHPDRGGDTAHMQHLNAARDKARQLQGSG
ncbi:hypothetical protein [Streptomyces synnematoformans]|uniref:Uncharacterized protein n=1 Tax=Streptomyces synnematoformans TaxID=415721 RepID=A0ABN2XEC0_9ACTN